MMLADTPENKARESIKTLCSYLKSVSKTSEGLIEDIDELLKYEYIDEESYHRMMRNEFIGLIKDLQGYIDLYLSKH